MSLCFSINTVYYMAPSATMILGVPAFLLEGNGILDWFEAHPSPWSALVIIFSSGVVAFCLNFSIFYVIHSTTAVTFNVAGNLKVKSKKILTFYLKLLQTILRPNSIFSMWWFEGCSGCSSFMDDIPKPDITDECGWMWDHTCGMHVLWICKPYAFSATTGNS